MAQMMWLIFHFPFHIGEKKRLVLKPREQLFWQCKYGTKENNNELKNVVNK